MNSNDLLEFEENNIEWIIESFIELNKKKWDEHLMNCYNHSRTE